MNTKGLKEVDRVKLFQRSRTLIRSRLVISKVWNSLSKQTMIFESPELPLAAGYDIRRSGLSFVADHKEYFKVLDLPIRSRPVYFKVFSWNLILRQTSFQIPSGLNFEGSQISGSFLKHNFEVKRDSIFAFCRFIELKKLKVVCWNRTN
ncbi:hypothetical protein RCL_jg22909.t1 [Rhizophagus clarus]|uniref:Uncharacterized protein n=1 Tax=Rhizophagus clarus TaxID=94130 RepID=A0A8H3LFM7_9GLOM|nr:hypothetical protein RCL_jg22909.t1 [Rhizophagus clarus]